MVDDHDLAGLDPYAQLRAEAARVDRFYSTASDELLASPSRLPGWSVRDVLAHLAATEDYKRACLNGTVQQLFAAMAEKGATDMDSFNEVGIRSYDGRPTHEILAEWRRAQAENVDGFEAVDGRDVDTSVGAYPGRWQAFHLAFEMAVHADDAAVPVPADAVDARVDWWARFGRFGLREKNSALAIEGSNGRTQVKGEGLDVDLPDAVFGQAVAGRLGDDSDLDAATRKALSIT
jgi:uncharacterized protein (TIGR03083 family)